MNTSCTLLQEGEPMDDAATVLLLISIVTSICACASNLTSFYNVHKVRKQLRNPLKVVTMLLCAQIVMATVCLVTRATRLSRYTFVGSLCHQDVVWKMLDVATFVTLLLKVSRKRPLPFVLAISNLAQRLPN